MTGFRIAGRPDRRQLLLGAAASGAALMASGAARAQDAPPSLALRAARLAARLDRAEALRAVRDLQNAYAHYLTFGMWAEAARLFSSGALMRAPEGAAVSPAEIAALLNAGQGEGIAPGRLNAVMAMSPVLNVSSNGRRALGRWRELTMRGRHGEAARWSNGIYENEYVLADGVWKIGFSNYYGRFEGPYDTGWRGTENGGEMAPFHYDPRMAGTPVPALPAVDPLAGGDAAAGAALGDLTARAVRLNDESAIRNLQNAYGYYVDRKMWDDVADLFAEDGSMELGNQGAYLGRASIRSGLDRFGPQGLKTGELNDHAQIGTVVTLDSDGRTARARGFELGMTGVNLMAGQWSFGVFENQYVKQDGVWKIAAMRVFPVMAADYAKGWAAGAIAPPGPSADFPPDRPPETTRAAYPDAVAPPPFSFPNPGERHAEEWLPAVTPDDTETAMAEAERLTDVALAYDGSENVSNAYGYYIDEFQWDDTALLYSEDGWKELSYVGAYVGRERVRDSLKFRYGLGGRFGSTMTLHQKIQPVISVAPDGQSARVRERLFQMNASPTAPGSYIGGIYENETVLENGVWKISGMDLDYVWLGDYAGGWTNVDAEANSRFAPPQSFLDQLPPDRPLRGVTFAPFPEIGPMGFHYPNPVSGREPAILLPPGGAPA